MIDNSCTRSSLKRLSLLEVSLMLSPAVIQALLDLVNEPEPDHPLRADIAEEFLKDRKIFFKQANEHSKKYAEKRPN
ncbi:unnamed protein product [Nezara viridula]|uniref:Uncharacterized protein n=1 Tax=Nezara viridula TaxID=85310 RepID=A0A9P0EGB9_NEZVI|nr:unnamed protein product [Nezara viridula]